MDMLIAIFYVLCVVVALICLVLGKLRGLQLQLDKLLQAAGLEPRTEAVPRDNA